MNAESRSELDVKALGLCIKRKRQRERLSLRDAAEQAQVSYPTLSRIENDQITPDVRTLKRVCQWLQMPFEKFTGKTAQPASVAEILEVGPGPKLYLPIADDRIRAGFPSPAESQYEERLDLSEHLIRHPLATFFVRVAGDSMTGANIHDGDLLIVDRAEKVRDGNIVIAIVNNEFCVKRFDTSGSNVILRSANAAFPDIELTPEDDWYIWGRVVHSIHRH
jgi:DNA polymerase V